MFGRLGDDILVGAILAVTAVMRLASAILDSWPPRAR